GGRGLEGRLDAALATAGVKTLASGRLAMGFARLSGGRTSVIIDAASPPAGVAGLRAHASTLAFELTSGRRPLIVSCGSGAPFGHDWHRAGRATASHSTLSIEGYSSSRLAVGPNEVLADRACVTTAHHIAGGRHAGPEVLTGTVRAGAVQAAAAEGSGMVLAQDGWAETHGLMHSRTLWLAADGRRLTGQEALMAATPQQRLRFDAVMTRTRLQGLRYALRFHLHPDVDAEIDLGGTAVSLALKSGEIWVFRHETGPALSLDPSVYLEKGRLRPRATKQIILSGTLQDFEARIGWTLAKAQDTPLAIRDTETG
ncbi:MAG: heparinase II/III-family protein, partial [Paracoccaceae bacterium]|nr:heparinase II/III-family protein [Paracoccaceae bacterium]